MSIGNYFSRFLGFILARLSINKRVNLIMDLIRHASSSTDKEESLKFLLEVDRRLYSLLGEASVHYGKGIHTKHKHLRYHDFFIKNIKPGNSVLDIGCGNGFLAYDIATKVKNTKVVGMDINKKNIEFAKKTFSHPGLVFKVGDVLKNLPEEEFDVVVLSNILEHLKDRVEFLISINKRIRPKKFLIRVPIFERDWRVPLRKELGLDYRLDETHYIEYTQEEFFNELSDAGLQAESHEIRWGEIWAVVKKE